MKTIKLELDFLIGPIVKEEFSVSKNELVTGVTSIDNNSDLTKLNDKIAALYGSFYEFDKDEACVFNLQIAKSHLYELKELVKELKEKLNLLNDGSFIIEDHIADQLKIIEQ